MDNEEKKEYLNQYRAAKAEMDRLEFRISELRSMKMQPSFVIDGMPRGNGQSDLSDYAAKLDELTRSYMAERYRRIKLFEEINHSIEALPDSKEKMVLFERYIKGQGWEEVCENINYSMKHAMRIHKNALTHLKIMEK